MSEATSSSHTSARSSTPSDPAGDGPARTAYKAAESALAQARKDAEAGRAAWLANESAAGDDKAHPLYVANEAALAAVDSAEAALIAARDVLADSDEPRAFTFRTDDGGEMTADAASMGDAIDLATDWAREGDYDAIESTIWVCVRIVGEDGTESATTVTINPDEPECDPDDGHDWQNPIELVGGLRENPGVYGHGGGVIIATVCMRCGAGSKEDTWAQDRATGRQGLESVAYEPPGTYDVSSWGAPETAEDEPDDANAIEAMTSSEAWDRYMGSQSRREFLATYADSGSALSVKSQLEVDLATADLARELSSKARSVLAAKLAEHVSSEVER